MATINASQLNQKIKLLPANLLQEVNDYIEYLTFKSSQKDWANDLAKEQISLIEKGKKDTEENRVISHKEARKQIDNYIKNKTR
jgi:phosphoserine aminotransferase